MRYNLEQMRKKLVEYAESGIRKFESNHPFYHQYRKLISPKSKYFDFPWAEAFLLDYPYLRFKKKLTKAVKENIEEIFNMNRSKTPKPNSHNFGKESEYIMKIQDIKSDLYDYDTHVKLCELDKSNGRLWKLGPPPKCKIKIKKVKKKTKKYTNKKQLNIWLDALLFAQDCNLPKPKSNDKSDVNYRSLKKFTDSKSDIYSYEYHKLLVDNDRCWGLTFESESKESKSSFKDKVKQLNLKPNPLDNVCVYVEEKTICVKCKKNDDINLIISTLSSAHSDCNNFTIQLA